MMTVASDDLPLGLRLNNPGNIKQGQPWRGLAAIQQHAVFATFIEPIYGRRAMAKILMRYFLRYGLNTVTGIVSRYAPASENALVQQKYIDFVAEKIGTQEITPQAFRKTLPALMAAMVHFELGRQPYPVELYEDAILLAEDTT